MVKYIKQLLQHHSKVILPQFGAIVLSDEETGTLMFNEYLTYDDGKILGLIENEEKIEREKAKNQIDQLIQEIKSELKKGASYSLGDLGVFTMDDDKIIFQGNLKSGESTSPNKKEPKEKASKKNVYVEKKDDASAPQDKVKNKNKNEDPKDKNTKANQKLKAEQKKAEKERLKKEKLEKKKADKAKKLKEKEERKRKKLEEKKKRKEEKARLKKEKEEKKKAEKAKKLSKVNKDKESKLKKSSKEKPKSDKSAAVVSSSTSKEGAAPKKDVKADAKKAKENKIQAEKERKIAEKKSSASSVKENIKSTPVKDKSKTNKQKVKKEKKESKQKPVVWILIILLLLLIGGGIWIGLNYPKVETFMGWNQFDNVDQSDGNEASTNNEGTIPIIDSLETEEESNIEDDTLNLNEENDSLATSTESEIINEEAKESPTQSSVPVATSSGDYHIIVGGFQVVSNAKNMVQSLKDQGFNSSMLEGTRTGLELHFVSAQSYSTLSDAKADLQRIKQSVNDGAWIYKN